MCGGGRRLGGVGSDVFQGGKDLAIQSFSTQDLCVFVCVCVCAHLIIPCTIDDTVTNVNSLLGSCNVK